MKVNIGAYPGMRSKKERKVKVKIEPWDTWNMDATLALIVHPMLLQLKETKHGFPLVADEDVPEELKSTSAPPVKNPWDWDDLAEARWDWVLDQMIWSFEQLNSDWEDQYHFGISDTSFVPVEVDGEEFFELKRGPNDTSTFDAEGYRAHDDKINVGLRLFGVYFRNLWD